MSQMDAGSRANHKTAMDMTREVPAQPRIPVGGYVKRRIKFLLEWKTGKTTFKVYGITTGSAFRSPLLVDAALKRAAVHLRAKPTRHTDYAVGFIAVHEGRGENQLIIDRWISENELMHQICVSSETRPTRFQRPSCDHNSVCVWEVLSLAKTPVPRQNSTLAKHLPNQ